MYRVREVGLNVVVKPSSLSHGSSVVYRRTPPPFPRKTLAFCPLTHHLVSVYQRHAAGPPGAQVAPVVVVVGNVVKGTCLW